MTVVYVDVLFLINFCMDFLSLVIAGASLHLEIRHSYLSLASALGGLYAVIAALYPGNAVIGTCIGVATACLLCYISYGRACRGKRFWCLFAFFYGASWLLGGMITGAYEVLRGFFENRTDLFLAITEGDGEIAFFFLLLLSCAFLLNMLKRHLYFKREEKSVDITVRSEDRTARLSALVDSGNMLCDPLSGKPCIVLSQKAAERLVPTDVMQMALHGDPRAAKLSGRSARRIRMIPADTVGGHRLLIGYRADKITVEAERGAHAVEALLVIGGGEDEYCGHAALIPAILT